MAGAAAPTGNDESVIDIDNFIWPDGDEVPAQEMTQSIPKVPITMSENLTNVVPNNGQWIKPNIVSIGPYHFVSGDYYEAQKLKSRHAQKFIVDSGQRKRDLFDKIKERTPELRKWYDDSPEIQNLNGNQMATMFLLDGCFLLNFINYSSTEDGLTELGLTNSELAHIKQDLFLLENQLPFEVLKLLVPDTSKPSMEEKIKDFVVSHVPFPRGKWEKMVDPPPLHLLHYLQAILLDKPKRISPAQNQVKVAKTRGRTHWRSCRTVQELVEVGIYFKPSAMSNLTGISFKPDDFGPGGCLRLPIISMNTSTIITFLNLIAFESSNTTQNLGVISYLCFMDSLIDSWDDVKELQAAGVLRNFVGEPRDVAQFFNIVCSKLVPNPSAYKDVTLQIESHVERHCKSKRRKLCVQCKQKYFSSPWSFIALIAAIIGLSLTAIQAFTSLFPRRKN